MPEPDHFEIDVDGERFVVSRSTTSDRGYDLEWVTGPNPGYGFSIAVLVAHPLGQGGSAEVAHEPDFAEQARIFLSMIDPATGYVAD